MKKTLVILLLLAAIMLLFAGECFAVQEKNVLETNTKSELIEEKNKAKNSIDEYTRKYGSEGFGTTAYILNMVRIFSIPLCFVGIAVGALYQYVLGTRRLDAKHKGFGLIIMFATLLVISQILPLIFAIVVRGWGD